MVYEIGFYEQHICFKLKKKHAFQNLPHEGVNIGMRRGIIVGFFLFVKQGNYRS